MAVVTLLAGLSGSSFAQKRINIRVIVLKKDSNTRIDGAEIRFDERNMNVVTVNGEANFQIDSATYYGKNVRIEARHPDYIEESPTFENIGEGRSFTIELSLPIFISGRVTQSGKNDPVPGARVIVRDKELEQEGVDTTNEYGIYRIKTGFKPGNGFQIELIHHDFHRPEIIRDRIQVDENIFDFELLPLYDDPDGDDDDPVSLPALEGQTLYKKDGSTLSGIVLTDYGRSLRTETDSLGKYVLPNLDRNWEEIKFLVESPKIGKFPLHRYKYILKAPRKKKHYTKTDFVLQDNYIINQPRWQLTIGLAALGGIAYCMAEGAEGAYEDDPRNISKHKWARTIRMSANGFFMLSGASVIVNITIFRKRPVTTRVLNGIKG